MGAIIAEPLAYGRPNSKQPTTEASPTLVVCEGKMGAWESAFTQLAIGNAYSTEPQKFIRFNIVQIGTNARVQATSWVETTMAFGQKRTLELTNPQGLRMVQDSLLEMGGRLP